MKKRVLSVVKTILLLWMVWLMSSPYEVLAQVPKTDKQPLDSPDIFRFAIMSDRTGGMIPGVFEKAVQKVNLMQPEFVLSVGDLIDGYTEDPKIWNAQWDEFQTIVDNLQMPFYFVPGNHDISNDLLLNEWKRRLGAPYWHFVHKNVLFLALHTEDKKGGGVGPVQIAYVKKVLVENPDVRWTLLFKHRPLWAYGNQSGYEEIEKALVGRNYTLFSGHHHHYMKGERNGMKHYILATTGGGSDLRGADFGEFEHITWVTMKNDGPHVAHIALDGIYDENLVTEANKTAVQTLRLGDWLQAKPILLPNSTAETFQTTLQFSNPANEPMHVFGTLGPQNGLTFYPATIDFLIPGKSVQSVELDIRNTENQTFHAINEAGVRLQLDASFVLDGKTLTLPAKTVLRADKIHDVPKVERALQIDGNLSDWNPALFTEITHPMFVQEDWDWKGAADGTFRFAIQADSKNLFLAIETTDDKTIRAFGKTMEIRQDKLFIQFASGDAKTQIRNEISVAPGGEKGVSIVESNFNKSIKITAKASIIENKTVIELSILLKNVIQESNEKQPIFRMNIGWMDHDRPENTKPSILWWRPFLTDSTFVNFATFLIKK